MNLIIESVYLCAEYYNAMLQLLILFYFIINHFINLVIIVRMTTSLNQAATEQHLRITMTRITDVKF